jgi:hypothetical protein
VSTKAFPHMTTKVESKTKTGEGQGKAQSVSRRGFLKGSALIGGGSSECGGRRGVESECVFAHRSKRDGDAACEAL